MMDFTLKQCEAEQLPEILEILNEALLNTTALYEYKPRTLDVMETWFTKKKQGNYPIIGAFDTENKLLGFASFGPFRDWPAYKYSIEHSVYVRSDARGKGLGRILLQEIINKAEEQNYHMIVAGIDTENKGSIKLHEKEGFVFCGTIKHAGYKFGKWLDLSFYQLILKSPANPVED
ncbi:GNAT family N-acetyltransferase [Chondrinema litorale]|uniref:GNAT family N-acetyltransferase n=1 Tax=Chondrinema litorale TaxID=2994555 RepID=UPI0025449305|nr:GNAT family N-acetyltransferase [Chondrinema litorale]UZR92711.1 GNAT family N-acetyltransferase [Chondrinema litorale]